MKSTVRLMLLVSLLAPAVLPLAAAVLPTVPMQGTMVMPMIRYDAAEARLRVTVNPAVPQLTPLLISNPADHFDPADPWYDMLDPLAHGLSFSRRYGFVMDTLTDPLPPGFAIVLKVLSASPELGFYRYRSSAPKVWEPIFGTAGAPTVFRWDGMMFHPAVTAAPGTNSYLAEFEAFLIDTTTGAEVPGSSTGPFELTWTNVADGRPSLAIGLKVVIGCPAQAEWVLEAADGLGAAAWVTVTNTPVLLEGQSSFILNATDARKFYRMRRQP
jgi:hypothetical protein